MRSCRHKERRGKITANTLEIHCAAKECKKLISVRTRVLSSNIYAIGRDGDDTEVTFMKNGAPSDSAVYYKVPKEIHNAFLKAKSKGNYFAEVIRKGGFEWKYLPKEISK